MEAIPILWSQAFQFSDTPQKYTAQFGIRSDEIVKACTRLKQSVKGRSFH